MLALMLSASLDRLYLVILIPGLPGLYPIPLMLYFSLLDFYCLDNASLSIVWISELILLLVRKVCLF